MTEIYRSIVTGAGPAATAFISQGMFVTFGEEAPAALREFCFLLDSSARTTADLQVGQVLVLDGKRYPITAVGSVARKNLDNLAHLTVNIDGGESAMMHGAIHVQGESMPQLGVGSTFVIEIP